MENLSAKLAEEVAKAARLEARLEISEKAQSTVKAERGRIAAHLTHRRERSERPEDELRLSRRSWWRCFFGLEWGCPDYLGDGEEMGV